MAGGYKTDDLSAYPWSVISHQFDGLRIMLKTTDTDLDFLCRGQNQGFEIFWNMPGEVPNSLSRSLFIPLERDVTVSMKASAVNASSSLLKYSPQLRQCYLDGEKFLIFFKTYTKSNCEFECLANFTLKICNCVKFSMLRDKFTSVCNATKLKCVLEAERSWLSLTDETSESALKCNCLPACLEISYEAQMFQTDFETQKIFKSYGYDLSDQPG